MLVVPDATKYVKMTEVTPRLNFEEFHQQKLSRVHAYTARDRVIILQSVSQFFSQCVSLWSQK